MIVKFFQPLPGSFGSPDSPDRRLDAADACYYDTEDVTVCSLRMRSTRLLDPASLPLAARS